MKRYIYGCQQTADLREHNPSQWTNIAIFKFLLQDKSQSVHILLQEIFAIINQITQ